MGATVRSGGPWSDFSFHLVPPSWGVKNRRKGVRGKNQSGGGAATCRGIAAMTHVKGRGRGPGECQQRPGGGWEPRPCRPAGGRDLENGWAKEKPAAHHPSANCPAARSGSRS